jgi:hypothetical protein
MNGPSQLKQTFPHEGAGAAKPRPKAEKDVTTIRNAVSENLGSLQAQFSIPSFQHGVLESRLTWTSPDASCEPCYNSRRQSTPA